MSSAISVADADATIAAISSPGGRGARAIVRLSGPRATDLAGAVFRIDGRPWQPREGFRWQRGQVEVAGGAMAPATAYVMRAPRSYTRQDVVELHVPASPPLVQTLLERLLAAGARAARPGEFTLRAFLNGRIDLVQAQAVAAIIEADWTDQLTVAVDELAGGLSGRLAEAQQHLTDVVAELEAGLDFVDEDISPTTADETLQTLRELSGRLETLARSSRGRQRALGRTRVVLAGRANAGKSSLMNALVGRPAALVAAAPGTTRDFVRETCRWDDVDFELIDTAGHAVADDAVARAARAAGLRQREHGHVVLWCLDTNRALSEDEPWDLETDVADHVLPVATKADLQRAWQPRDVLPTVLVARTVETSVVDGRGIGRLRRRLIDLVRGGTTGTAAAGWTLGAHLVEALGQAREAVDRAVALIGPTPQPELACIELRTAIDVLGELLGTVSNDDILGRIFSRFCIGK